MSTNVVIPPLGESVTEAVLLRWLKNDGEQVSADQPVVELETDKANVEIPTPVAGILRRGKKEGETVKVGESIAQIEAGTAAAASPAPSPKPPAAQAPAPSAVPVAKGTETKAASAVEDLRPSVRRLVEENKLDASTIAGTGPGARILKEDVLRKLDEQKPTGGNGAPSASPSVQPSSPLAASRTPAPAAASAPPTILTSAGPAATDFDAQGIKRVAMTKIRKRIAERLVQAQQTAAILTTVNEIDMSEVIALRTKYKERFAEIHGVSLGFMSFFARAVVLALREFPRVNAFIEGDEILYHNYVNLGIAVSTERGLTVPVLQHVEAMSFGKIETEIKRLATAARDGKLALQELSGATFTITNGGIYGSLLSTPIISPPESGILGMHAIKDRPVAIAGKVEIRPMMYIALSYDHRMVDGRESVSFLVRLKESLEDPARLMLEI